MPEHCCTLLLLSYLESSQKSKYHYCNVTEKAESFESFSDQFFLQCLSAKYRTGPSLLSIPAICWAVTICICLGNQVGKKQSEQILIFVKFYELNTFAGGLDAVLALPGAGDLQGGFKQNLSLGKNQL